MLYKRSKTYTFAVIIIFFGGFVGFFANILFYLKRLVSIVGRFTILSRCTKAYNKNYLCMNILLPFLTDFEKGGGYH